MNPNGICLQNRTHVQYSGLDFMRNGFATWLIAGVVRCTSKDFCSEDYCYESDGKERSVKSLEEVEKKCKKGFWPLEIYESERTFLFKKLPKHALVLLNTMASFSDNYLSVHDKPLPSEFSVEKGVNEYLTLTIFKTDVSLSGELVDSECFYICRLEGKASGSYRIEVVERLRQWFSAEKDCMFNRTLPNETSGHLLTFDGMTKDDVSKIVLKAAASYWVGYSRLYYKWRHSKTRITQANFKPDHPQFKFSETDKRYLVGIKHSPKVDHWVWEEFLPGSEKSQIYVMKASSTKSKAPAGRFTPPSLVLTMLPFYQIAILLCYDAMTFRTNTNKVLNLLI